MYNDGKMSISFQNGSLQVHFKDSSHKTIIGWYGGQAKDKWIRGYFCCIICNLIILLEQKIGERRLNNTFTNFSICG